VSDDSAQNSNVAWTRDVNHIGAEIAHQPQNPRIVPQEEKIKFVVAVERERERAAA
jgi:hypothetical protein